jgi:L,D-transpeptidase YcbB
MRKMINTLVLALGLWFAVSVGLASAGYAASAEDVRAAIQQILSGGRLPLPLERAKGALSQHYLKSKGPIYWVGSGRTALFVQRLNNAVYDGLNASDYPIDSLISVGEQAGSGDAFDMANAELYFSSFFIAYAADLKVGRVSPQKVDPNLFRSRKTIDGARVLAEMSKQKDPGKFLAAFEPKNNHYQVLKKMLRVYTNVLNEGGVSWPRIADGAPIKPGASDARVSKIRQILSVTGDYPGDDNGSPKFDQATVQAMIKFQQRHGLEAKGLVGKQSIVALNVSPAERQKQIILNMERWRWMPDTLGSDHFLVNIAGFELQRISANQVVDRMNVVVGAVATQTPEFTGSMQYVELNPTWTVPYSIATKEMLAKLQRDPYAYADDFDLFAGGKLADWGSVSWGSVGPGNFRYTFRQRPGPKNALGKVKFMLPNKHNIYLHDTPAKDKFANTTRAFSHGCIRLSQPAELAYSLLGEKRGMSAGELDSIWASGETTQVKLPQQIPVHLVYATAFATGNGIEFRPDVYGRDRKLYSALFGRGGV